MIQAFYSLIKSIQIELSRFFDHAIRNLTGSPVFKYSEITPQLFVGGQYWSHGVGNLAEREISAVVNMRMGSIYKSTSPKRIKYLHLPTHDRHAPTIEHLKMGVSFIDKEIKNGGKVYIHCMWGEGRGPTMAIAYLIHGGLNLKDAIATVKKARPFIHPTFDQLQQLEKFERLASTSK
jgi:protein-tyrosine phosphatase